MDGGTLFGAEPPSHGGLGHKQYGPQTICVIAAVRW